MRIATGIFPVAVVALAVTISSGCATKKFVRTTVSPLEQRIGELDKKTGEQGNSIEELERGVSRADEHAMSADAKAVAAATEAARANEQASPGKSATDARSLVERGLGEPIGSSEDREHRQLQVGIRGECPVQFRQERTD
jgi:uncharacterized coiled-coil protein SlyX